MEPPTRSDDERPSHRELRQYRTLVETAGDPMFVLDDGGHLELLNDAMAAFASGHSKEEIRGQHVRTVTTEEGFRKGTEALRRLLSDESDEDDWTSYEMWDRSPEGEERYYEVRIGVVRDQAGEFIGSVGTIRDITERKKREQDLALLKQILTRILRHNVRNELTVIEGHAETLTDVAFEGDPSPEAAAILERAEALHDVSEKARVIEDIIDSRGQRVRHELPALLTRAIEAVERDHPGATIQRAIPTEGAVRGIPELRVAVVNLLENAVEHGSTSPRSQAQEDAVEHGSTSPPSQAQEDAVEHGGEAVRLTVEQPSPSVISIVVEDDGPGIPADELAVLEAGEETDLAHGSGIGLWLAQWAVDRSGGELVFDTDEGTRVEIRLPPDEGPGTPPVSR